MGALTGRAAFPSYGLRSRNRLFAALSTGLPLRHAGPDAPRATGVAATRRQRRQPVRHRAPTAAVTHRAGEHPASGRHSGERSSSDSAHLEATTGTCRRPVGAHILHARRRALTSAGEPNHPSARRAACGRFGTPAPRPFEPRPSSPSRNTASPRHACRHHDARPLTSSAFSRHQARARLRPTSAPPSACDAPVAASAKPDLRCVRRQWARMLASCGSRPRQGRNNGQHAERDAGDAGDLREQQWV
jgi:hypothetical protein